MLIEQVFPQVVQELSDMKSIVHPSSQTTFLNPVRLSPIKNLAKKIKNTTTQT